jgi:NDP-sugar pyrophosphorylase family protein
VTQTALPNPTTAILAGGLATRLFPVTAGIPKSMVSVAGEPFIAHQLRNLASQGFAEVVICAGHLGEQIEDFVGTGARFGCHVQYSFDGHSPRGTGGAIRHALPLLGEAFLVMYGDSYLRQPLQPIWHAFLSSRKPALMTVYRNDGQGEPSNVEIRQGRIVYYDKTAPTPAMRHIDYGIGCICSLQLAAFPAADAFDIASYYSALARNGELAAFEVSERFYEIGSPAGLAETESLLQSRHAAKTKPKANHDPH